MNKAIFIICVLNFIFVSFPVQLEGQNEQVIVEGGIEIDSIFIRNLPAFRAESTQTYDITNLNSNTIVLFNDSWVDQPVTNHFIVFDSANNFDPSTGIFTAPRKGLYWLQSDLVFIGNRFFDDRIEAFISVNGNTTNNCIKGRFLLQSGGNTNSSNQAFCQRNLGGIILLNEGDQISLQLLYVDSAGFALFELDKGTSLTGYLISDID